MQLEFPNNKTHEEGLISCILQKADVLDECQASGLEPDAFYFSSTKLIYSKLCELNNAGTPIDEVYLMDSLAKSGDLDESGGAGNLFRILNLVETSAHSAFYQKSIVDLWLKRKLLTLASNSINCVAKGKDLKNIIATLQTELIGLDNKEDDTMLSAETVMKAASLKINDITKGLDGVYGISTGLEQLNKKIGGLAPGKVYVVAARPGKGKSALGLCLVEAAITQNVPTVVFSLEMDATELGVRFAMQHSKTNFWKIRDRLVNNDGLRRLANSVSTLEKSPFWFEDCPDLNAIQVRMKSRKMKARHGCGLIVLDYLQLLTPEEGKSNSTRAQAVGEMSRQMKLMARELQLPVVILAQLNRKIEQEKNREPVPSDLKESGSIEQDADVIIFPHEKAGENGEIENYLIIGKHRGGPIGNVPVKWIPEFTRFEDKPLELDL